MPISNSRAPALSGRTCYMMVRDLEGSPPEVKARKIELAAT